ncbi:MAG TPA: myo-inosose-2 dehydratase [Steroidobacteraceae bacterium]|jgi:inosose dehydratase|nr:myo-inosose-2 dehydratase [Steroidobacteraceae bacterium]
MSIRFGVSPIAWINDDLPALGGDTPLESVLTDASELGFAGIELGGKFPREPAALRAMLEKRHLALVGGWYSASLLTRSAEAEIQALQPHLGLLKAMGSGVFILAETSNAIHGHQSCPLSMTPRLADSDWNDFGRKLTAVADYLAGAGLRMAYHHHLGTVVETQRDLERFLKSTGSSVGLTVDTGHAALGGVETLSLIRENPERIAHVHCKDIRASIYKKLRSEGGSFLSGVLKGMFTVPGDGNLEFGAVMQALAQVRYSGWIIVEAEQDPALANPRVYAALGLKTLRREASAANLFKERS